MCQFGENNYLDLEKEAYITSLQGFKRWYKSRFFIFCASINLPVSVLFSIFNVLYCVFYVTALSVAVALVPYWRSKSLFTSAPEGIAAVGKKYLVLISSLNSKTHEAMNLVICDPAMYDENLAKGEF